MNRNLVIKILIALTFVLGLALLVGPWIKGKLPNRWLGKSQAQKYVYETTPAAEVTESQCRDKFILLDREAVKSLYTTNRFNYSKIGVAACFPVGAKVALASKSGFDSDFLVMRGYARVAAVSSENQVSFELVDTSLELTGLLAPVCDHWCDGVLDGYNPSQPAENLIAIAFVSQKKLNKNQLKTFNFLALPISDEKTVFEKWLSSIGPVKDKDFIITAESPAFHFRFILKFAKRLKKEGAKSVRWLYQGLYGLQQIPMFPPSIAGVKEVRWLPIRSLAKESGFAFVYANSNRSSESPSISLSLEVKLFDKEYFVVDATNFSQTLDVANERGIDVYAIPSDKNLPYVVFGTGPQDWRAYFLLRYLSSKGYTNLSWLRGGNAEVLEAQKLGL